MGECYSCGVHKEIGLCNMWPGIEDPHLGITGYNFSHSTVRPREEHFSWSASSSVPGSTNWMVAPSLPLASSLYIFWLIYLPQEQTHSCPCMCLPSRSHGLEGGCFATQLEQSWLLCLPSFCCSSKIGPFKSSHLLQLLHDPDHSTLASGGMVCWPSTSGGRPSWTPIP